VEGTTRRGASEGACVFTRIAMAAGVWHSPPAATGELFEQPLHSSSPLVADMQMHQAPADTLSERQLELVHAGLRVVDEVGADGLSMRRLAEEVGLSPMATYKHFDNQQAFQVALWMSCMYTFNRGMIDGVNAHPDRPVDGFIALCRAFMEYAFRHPRRFEYLMANPLIDVIRETDTTNQRQVPWNVAVSALERAQAAGQLRVDRTVPELTLAVLGQLHGASHMVLTRRSEILTGLDGDAVIDLTLEVIRTFLTCVSAD
jgi:AcrR family transcriptional regulator